MSPMPESLAARVRGEYREMPGLRLTFPQACRLWHLDAATCESVLRTLVKEGFLLRTPEGKYIAMPASDLRAHSAKAHLPFARRLRGIA
jgi:hypothetical protein